MVKKNEDITIKIVGLSGTIYKGKCSITDIKKIKTNKGVLKISTPTSNTQIGVDCIESYTVKINNG